jgi:hypothetical protein
MATMHPRPLLLALLLVSTGSYAAGIAGRVGTTGVGGDIGWELVPTLNARIGYSALNFKRNVDSGDVHYDGKVKLSNLSGLLDWSPLPGPFRVTGGVILNDNRYDVNGQPASNATFTLNGRTYQASDVGSLTGTVKSGRPAAPYLGVGYGNIAGAGVNFFFDLGVMFQGSPKATLNASCSSSLSASQCSQLQSDTAEEARRLEDKLSRYKYYPVANIGITIGF